MQTHNLGYPRIGSKRELKKACESYWSGKINLHELQTVGESIRLQNWKTQQEEGIDLIPSNDFSFYDQVLDMSLMLGAIPDRFHEVILQKGNNEMDLYFAMARGYQQNGLDITAMEMTKWFDTNYHYIVPEFRKDQQFKLFSTKVILEYKEAKQAGFSTKPVLIGPVSYLLLGKEKEADFDRIDLIKNLLPVYLELLKKLDAAHVEWIQFDEPFLAMDLGEKEKRALQFAYAEIKKAFPSLKIILANYFDCFGENLETALSLPVHTLHLDLVRCSSQLDDILESGKLGGQKHLSLGLVDGRNIWKNDYQKSNETIQKAVSAIGKDRLFIAPSCSLIHSPIDLDLETDEKSLSSEIKNWLSFAKQKLREVADLKELTNEKLKKNQEAIQSRNSSPLIHKPAVKKRVQTISDSHDHRLSPFSVRQVKQKEALKLPLFPTTTIGSFPQTAEVRSWRSKFKKGSLSQEAYEDFLKEETKKAISLQENIGLDVLVHGEFERNDMVEYFGEQLEGFVFTKTGWVQSYGSRCVKPPIIYGDVSRPQSMTVDWTAFGQSLTSKFVKGMLTGPVTILQWSFVRNDQPRSETCLQIALAIRDEVTDLEKAGIRIIQIDEPAIREGLPLRKSEWQQYLNWAVRAFRISSSGVKNETQIHTHMCYSEFNDIIQHIADMDADVITIECSRSQMELLDAFREFNYPNEIGPGVYDIHSPRVPSKQEMVDLLEKAMKLIPETQLWVNPDCGLKTRGWDETKKALTEMVSAAQEMREVITSPIA